MSFNLAYPTPKLRPFIKQFWAMENVLNSGEACSQRIVPSGLPELILYINDKPKSDKRSIEAHCLLNGQHNDYFDLHFTEDLSIFSVLFEPQGVSQFFNLPFNELTNQSVPLEFINSAFSKEFQSRLSESISFNARVNIAEEIFCRQLTKDNRSYDFKRMGNTVELIKNAKGVVEIDLLSQQACLSRKQFERLFLGYIGISPKQYLKIIRFQSSLYYNSQRNGLSMTQLAHASGYYDQSHFINDFKTLTGLTPKKFFEDCDSVSDFFE
jgi:AraC-like DNA-binding protein